VVCHTLVEINNGFYYCDVILAQTNSVIDTFDVEIDAKNSF
jgi:hypothetical protein